MGRYALSYIGFSPKQAQTVLRELSETLITDHNQQRSRQVKQTREFLDAELVRLSEDVRTRETALKEFLARHPEAASINDDAPMVDPGSLVLEQQLAQLRSQARTRSGSGSTGGARSTSEIVEQKRTAETERETAQRELQSKLDTLTEAHPDVIVARERLKRAQGEVGRFNGQLEKASGGAGPGGQRRRPGDQGDGDQAGRDALGVAPGGAAAIPGRCRPRCSCRTCGTTWKRRASGCRRWRARRFKRR